MAEIKEVHKEKIIYDHSEPLRGPDSHVHEVIHERPARETAIHTDRIIHEDRLIRDDHGHLIHDDRHDYRTRRVVRREILSFRRGAYLILDIIQVLLIARFFVELFGLSDANPFAAIIRILSYPLIAPFGNIMTFISPYLAINWSILIAMLVYALIAWIVVNLFESGMRAAYRRH